MSVSSAERRVHLRASDASGVGGSLSRTSATGGKRDGFPEYRARQVQQLVMPRVNVEPEAGVTCRTDD